MTDKEISAANGVLESEITRTVERLNADSDTAHRNLIDAVVLSVRIGQQTLRIVGSLLEQRRENDWGSLNFGKFGKATGKSVVFLTIAIVALGYMYFHSNFVAGKAEQVAEVAQTSVQKQAERGARMEKLLTLMEASLQHQ